VCCIPPKASFWCSSCRQHGTCARSPGTRRSSGQDEQEEEDEGKAQDQDSDAENAPVVQAERRRGVEDVGGLGGLIC
jgi:hypothetical protein